MKLQELCAEPLPAGAVQVEGGDEESAGLDRFSKTLVKAAHELLQTEQSKRKVYKINFHQIQRTTIILKLCKTY